MMKLHQKGYVLIIVVMITTVLSITTLGLLPVMMGTANITKNDLDRNELVFAAEGGLKSLYANLSRLTPTEFKKGASESKVKGNGSLTINGITVNLSAIHAQDIAGEDYWELAAQATNSNNKKCTQIIKNIRITTMLDNALGFTGDMLGATGFCGKIEEDGTRSITTDHILGKTYFGGKLNIYGAPWFEGTCTYAKKTDKYNSNFSGDDNWYYSETGFNYKHGIYDRFLSSMQGIYGDSRAEYKTDENMAARYGKMFEKGSYNISDAPIDFSKSLYSWSDLTDTAQLTSLDRINKTADNRDDIHVTLRVDPDGKNIVQITGGGMATQNIDADTTDVITIETRSTSRTPQYVHISGVIDSDITLAIDRGVVKIDGDLYYKGFEGYTSLTQSEILAEDDNKIQALREKLNDGTHEHQRFALINYSGHILIDKTSNEKYAAGSGTNEADNALLTMGAFCAPNGQYGAQASSEYSVIYRSTGERISNGSLQVVSIGSILCAQKAFFKFGNGNGMASHINSDPRYESGLKPNGIPPTIKAMQINGVDYDYLIFSEFDMEWSMEWD